MKLEVMAISPDPLLLQARRIRLAHVGKVALEPVCVFGPGHVLQRRPIHGDAAPHKNAKHVCGQRSAQRQRRDEERAKDGEGEQHQVSTVAAGKHNQAIVHVPLRDRAPQVRFVW